MYENIYKNEGLTASRDLETFLNLLADLDEELELFALGGTAMVLKGIREATKDIDFLTTAKYEKIKRLFGMAGLKEESPNRICNIWRLGNIRIDIFYEGFILGVPFPEDWKELSEKIKDIGKIRLSVLNWYDVEDSGKPCPLGQGILEHPKHERFSKPRPSGRGAHRAFDIIITKIARSEKRDIEDILAILKSQRIDFSRLKKRYYSLAETAIISEYDYKFKHLEEEYARRKAH